MLLVSTDLHKLVVSGVLNWTQHKRPKQLALDRVLMTCSLHTQDIFTYIFARRSTGFIYLQQAHHSLIHIASGPDDKRAFRRHVQVCVDSSTLSVVLAGFEITHVYTLYTIYLCFFALQSHHSFSRSQVTCSMASY